ncbi:NAD(P)/FAD-dependent oxidoreductase [Roseibium aggregatum]|uniref:FAD-binding oxidoreductase n=1 Tax=Roseibium aggregatum TaxID=187304 RepID=A0A939J693_9HYPH|nr:FAD-binding oxidoreductase [Roseibium aggregatum]MBN9672554.1 FAD-binding oxidoreductase [Roseibium aggregatum]
MQKSVLIVGAGITGLAAAEWLRREGWATTLIDPVHPGSPEQSSYGNAGLLARTSVMPVAAPSLVRKAPAMLLDPDSPLYMRWSYLPRLLPWLVPFIRNLTQERIAEISQGLSQVTFDTNEQHLALAAGTPAERHIQSGDLVTLYKQRQDYESDTLTIETRRRYGLEPVPMTREQLLERDPNLGPAYQFATVFDDCKWLSSPGDYAADLFAHHLSLGGIFRQARVADITPGSAPFVTLEGGDVLEADKIVLTAGVWSGPIAKRLGIKMKLEAERGYHVSIGKPEFTAPQPYMVTDAKIVLTPMRDALRGAGVVEFAGISGPPAKAPPNLIEKAVRRVYPTLDFDKVESWMGRRPTTPDSLPVVGESAKAPNVLHAYGGQHVGLTIGPKLGRMVADLASDRLPNTNLTPYRPDRF